MRRLLLILGLLGMAPIAARAENPVTVFAAASLKAAFADLSAAWALQGHPALIVTLGSSGLLAKQIQQGAPADIFVSADRKWMDYLSGQKQIVPSSRRDLLTNTLVLVAPSGQARPVTLTSEFNLGALIGAHGRLAVGDPASVPAGIYAKQALTKLGLWSQAQARLAPAVDVKAALALVEHGEVPAGIVYGTDARDDPKVTVIAMFPPSSHDPIVYPVALIAPGGQTPQARRALRFLQGTSAQAIYAKYGFGTK